MKKTETAIAIASVTALIGAPALAADMSVKAPPRAKPAPVYNWTGGYVGGNIGVGWGTADNNISFTQTTPGLSPASFSAQDSARFHGAIGGIQAGYNWQVRNFLLGFETDIQAASGHRVTNTISNGSIFSADPAPNPATDIDNEKLDWFGTVRGRLGLTFDRWLVYGTGGLAYGKVDLNGNVQPATVAFTNGFNAPIVWARSTVQVGWVAGVGIENQIDSQWSWKVEYLFVDLGVSAPLSGGVGSTGSNSEPGNCYGASGGCNFYLNPASGTAISRFADNIVRVGLNYQFH